MYLQTAEAWQNIFTYVLVCGLCMFVGIAIELRRGFKTYYEGKPFRISIGLSNVSFFGRILFKKDAKLDEEETPFP